MDRVAPLAEVPEDSTYLFRVRPVDGDEEQEVILVRLDGGVAGWLNYCRHVTHVRLDKGSGAAMRGDEIVCRNHGAMFEVDTGLCTFGPCEGAYLEAVDVGVRDDAVYLDDPWYEYVGPGPLPDDGDLSSTSNLEF